MFFRKSKTRDPYASLIKDLKNERSTLYYNYKLKDSRVGKQLLAATLEEQRGFVLYAIEWLTKKANYYSYEHPWLVRAAMLELLRQRLPFTDGDLAKLIKWSVEQPSRQLGGTGQLIKILETFLKDNEPSRSLRKQIDLLIVILEHLNTAETRKWVLRLDELDGQADSQLPLVLGEAWSDTASCDIGRMKASHQSSWLKLLNLCTKGSGSAPTAKWLKTSMSLVDELGAAEFRQMLLRWFPLVDKPRTQRIESWSEYEPDPNNLIQPFNADILKSLVWLCAQTDDKEMTRALTNLAVSAYRKVPGVGPRCARVGNACVWALGAMPGNEGVGQLALLKVKIKSGSTQKVIEKALETAASRIGLPRDEIVELSVPTYGLQDVGLRKLKLSDFTAEITVTGPSTTELKWFKPDGKRQSSTPQVVKELHAEELKELNQAIKDIRKMVPAQSARIEQLYLERKNWTLRQWRERYLDHPLVGTLARRLIWKFCNPNQTVSGIWHQGKIVSSDENSLDWLDETTKVELWHPLDETSASVMRWREWLLQHEIQQPFKQAHREIYILTDAENTTSIYSNRFAAHVIKQHQFNALCGARGWKNQLRLMVDDECPPSLRMMPAWELRAEFWVESIGEDYGIDTTEAGTFLYLATDQVRFYHIDAWQHTGHVGGGGYNVGGHGPNPRNEPLTMQSVPPLVFSEIMRDVDLFVGVASVANDPTWSDGGPNGRYQTYWTNYSFGDLSETAKTRKQVLERLIPRLKIADRCTLSEKFLTVRGDVRTYNIHLGSGNILMEPNDQYLCIVAAPSRGGDVTGKMFLPFEGDNMLSIILSKAFLLAEDWKITDRTILTQIGA